jgi:hypothetical protein
VLVPILYALRWDVDNRTQNIVGLLLAEALYVKKYKAAFPRLTNGQGSTGQPLARRPKMLSA